MINLLPYDEQEKNNSERLRRLIIVVGIMLSAVFFVGITLIIPTYLTLFFEQRELERQLSIGLDTKNAAEVGPSREEIKALNSKLSLYTEGESKINPVAEVLDKILKLLPQGLDIRLISYNQLTRNVPERIVIEGSADRRENFLVYLSRLESSGEFLKVDSPVSNLLRETDLNFSLTLEIRNENE